MRKLSVFMKFNGLLFGGALLSAIAVAALVFICPTASSIKRSMTN